MQTDTPSSSVSTIPLPANNNRTRHPATNKFTELVHTISVPKLNSITPRILISHVEAALDTGELRGLQPIYKEKFVATLFVDVCGFTTVAEALQQEYGQSEGAEKLTHALNAYFTVILDVIKKYHGDVTLFSGDAIVACWFADVDCEKEVKQSCCQCACACALTLMSKCSSFPVLDQVLTLHMGSSCGNVSVIIAGGAQSSSQGRFRFCVVGQPISDSSVANSIATKGECVVHTSIVTALGLAQPVVELTTTPTTDSSYVYLKTITEPAAKSLRRLSFHSAVQTTTHYKKALMLFSFEAALRSYVFESPGENREVSTVFVNFYDLTYAFNTLTPPQAYEQIQKVFVILQKVLSKYEGICNKFYMDDKGILALCIFGLPGAVHEDDATRSGNFALSLASTLRKKSASRVAVGISRAKVFLGCTGSTWRSEYTVLGDGVNIAARLMGYAAQLVGVSSTIPSTTIADCATRSAIGVNSVVVGFSDAHKISVKNKTEPLTVYSLIQPAAFVVPNAAVQPDDTLVSPSSPSEEGGTPTFSRKGSNCSSRTSSFYGSEAASKLQSSAVRASIVELETDEEINTIVGRDEVFAAITKFINVQSEKKVIRTQQHTPLLADQNIPLMCFVGDPGLGKTLILEKILSTLQSKSIHALYFTATEANPGNPFSTLRNTLKDLIQWKCIDYSWLLAEFNAEDVEYLSVLNDVIKIDELEANVMVMTEDDKISVVNRILLEMLRRALVTNFFILIDSFQYCDSFTASFVLYACRQGVPVMMTRRPTKAILQPPWAEQNRSASIDIGSYVLTDDFDIADDDGFETTFAVTRVYYDDVETDWMSVFSQGYGTSIELMRLSKDQFQQLLTTTLNCVEIDPDIVDLLHVKCEGNPGHCVEAALSLKRTNQIRISASGRAESSDNIDMGRALESISTLQAIFMKTIDTLSDPLQKLLGICSVLGTTFTQTHLLQCVELYQPTKEWPRATVILNLDELESVGVLLQERSTTFQALVRKNSHSVSTGGTGPTYQFAKALLKDAVYNRMLVSQRRDIHAVVADVYCRYPNIEMWKIAFHCARGGDIGKALSLLHTAASDALGRGDPKFCMRHLRETANLLSSQRVVQLTPQQKNENKFMFVKATCDLTDPEDGAMLVTDTLRGQGQKLPEKSTGFKMWLANLLERIPGFKTSTKDVVLCQMYQLYGDQTFLIGEMQRSRLGTLRSLNTCPTDNHGLQYSCKVSLAGIQHFLSRTVKNTIEALEKVEKKALYGVGSLRHTVLSVAARRNVFWYDESELNEGYASVNAKTCSQIGLVSNYILLGAFDYTFRTLEDMMTDIPRYASTVKILHCYAVCMFQGDHFDDAPKKLLTQSTTAAADTRMQWHVSVVRAMWTATNGTPISLEAFETFFEEGVIKRTVTPCAFYGLALAYIADILNYLRPSLPETKFNHYFEKLLATMESHVQLQPVLGVAYEYWKGMFLYSQHKTNSVAAASACWLRAIEASEKLKPFDRCVHAARSFVMLGSNGVLKNVTFSPALRMKLGMDSSCQLSTERDTMHLLEKMERMGKRMLEDMSVRKWYVTERRRSTTKTP